MKKYRGLLLLLLVILATIGLPELAEAQCPMCKIAAESDLKNGGTAGRGLNRGILYMLAMPYLFVFLFGLLWYKNKRTDEV